MHRHVPDMLWETKLTETYSHTDKDEDESSLHWEYMVCDDAVPPPPLNAVLSIGKHKEKYSDNYHREVGMGSGDTKGFTVEYNCQYIGRD